MVQEFAILHWCNLCIKETGEKVYANADDQQRITLNGETRVLDLCTKHKPEVLQAVQSLLDLIISYGDKEDSAPIAPPSGNRTRKTSEPGVKWYCPECGPRVSYAHRNSLNSHCNQFHKKTLNEMLGLKKGDRPKDSQVPTIAA